MDASWMRRGISTVHYRVQVLTHNAAAHPNVWNEGSDSIASEARGSALLERYVDPDDPRLRDFATDRNATLDDCYKFRVIRVQRVWPPRFRRRSSVLAVISPRKPRRCKTPVRCKCRVTRSSRSLVTRLMF